MPLDYSKWKTIEVSDDEDETHPNIDTPSLFRWRHRARMERTAERKDEREKIIEGKSSVEERMQEIENKLKDTDLNDKDRVKLELEREEIRKQEEEYERKEKELEEKEKREPWNVDTIGQEAFSKSRINKIGEKKAKPPKLSEEEESERMEDYFKRYEDILDQLGMISELDESEKFLLEHPHLVSNFAANYLTMRALNLAMAEEDKEMCVMAKQTILIQYILEMASNLSVLPTNTDFIKTFFSKMRLANPTYMAVFTKEVEDFCDRLRKRGIEKRAAALEEMEAEEKKQRIAESPGGLDPQEVYEALPKEMREAFDSLDVTSLQAVAATMDKEVFCYHLDRCIASGLWIPDKNTKKK